MAQWTILLFSLYGVLQGQDNELPTEKKCCQDGMDWAKGGQRCANLTLVSSSPSCRTAQEQCCAETVENGLCEKGIQMSMDQWVCERPFFQGEPWQTQISKMCCDCCMLGMVKASQHLSCKLPGLLLGRKCLYTAKACCNKTTTAEIQPTANAPVTEKPQAIITAKPTKRMDPCIASNCSQVCERNGTCSCLGGYRLKKDGVSCEDVNECLTGSHNCVAGKVCINTDGSFSCQRQTSCGTGYELKDDTCRDIDECALVTHNCEAAFLCTNTAGSFRCAPGPKCSGGFIRDATGSCIDVNECVAHTSPCPHGQTCINTLGSYTCRRYTVPCGPGYRLTEDGLRCEDVDECRTGDVCGGNNCVNLLGTFRCECKTGFTFNSIKQLCEDINECRHYPGRLCSHKCENTEGSYQCSCNTGFKLSPNNRNCDDINECDAKPCNQECTNVFGSYHCSCRGGYQLSDSDGITCKDIDECAGGHVCSYRCSNAPGSFSCTCPPTGYTLAYDGRTCQDIDECAVGSHTCHFSENCFNIQGRFRCLSFTCPQNFRRTEQGSTRHASVMGRCVKACQPNDRGCSLNPVQIITHISIAPPTFKDFSKPHEIVYLQTAVATYHTIDVFFDILVADDQFSFDVVKRYDQGMLIGVVRQVKPINGTKDIVLEVAMNYVKSRQVSHRNIAIISVFISEFWF